MGETPLVAIVDDDASARLSMSRLIRTFGYKAETFGSGGELLGSGLLARIACVFLDMRMPGMDGLEVQRRLREAGVCIPIIFLTGRASDDEERRARDAGAAAFFRKPVGRETLLQALESVLHAAGPVGGGGDGDD
jgi:two-component system response regulator FixJ